MEVTHINGSITHAVIGGEQTIEFGINADAAFFNMLSNTLYSNKKLAVVRETLCNAWDAHIVSGRTHIPLQITIENDRFIIQDSGLGIHKDQMGPIYGVYGGSTKKNDGNQTGGFGLGCKAPFSITDHFEVTSAHEGVKTIYNLSKSSAKVKGKMGIVPIASFPTTETGLTVSIPISRMDASTFASYVKQVAANGEINLLLNGSKVDVLPFSEAKHDFLITNARVMDGDHRIYVRYGNVIYPIEQDGNYSSTYQNIRSLLSRIEGSTTYRIIFQAPPHSIAVTPSRESLSMEDHTINTLKMIFANFLQTVGKTVEVECLTYVQESISTVAAHGEIDRLFSRDHKVVRSANERGTNSPLRYITTPQDMGRQYARHSYPTFADFRKKDLLMRVNAMIKNGFGNLGLLQSYRKELSDCLMYTDSDWFQKRVLGPLLNGLRIHPELSPETLFVYDKKYGDVIDQWRNRTTMHAAKQYKQVALEHSMGFLRNVVVIVNRKSDLEERLMHHPDMEKIFFHLDQFLVYFPGRKASAIAAACDLFQKRGMTVVDMTGVQPWETAKTSTTPKKRTVKKGLPMLSGVLTEKVGTVSTFKMQNDDAPRIEHPEFYSLFTFNKLSPKDHFQGYTAAASHAIAKLFGDKGAVLSNSRQEDIMRSKGIPEMDAYVAEHVSFLVTTDPILTNYYSHSLKLLGGKELLKFSTSTDLRDDLGILMSIKEIREEFGLVDERTEREILIWKLWESINTDAYRYRYQCVKDAHKALEAVEASPKGTELCRLVAKSFLVPLLDLHHTKDLLTYSYATNSPERTKIINLLTSALKG